MARTLGSMHAVRRALHALVVVLAVLGALSSLRVTQAAAVATLILRADAPSDVGPEDASEHEMVLDHRYVARRDVASRLRVNGADPRAASFSSLARGAVLAMYPRTSTRTTCACEVAVRVASPPRERSMVFLN